jgi:uncharacterized membrane protein
MLLIRTARLCSGIAAAAALIVHRADASSVQGTYFTQRSWCTLVSSAVRRHCNAMSATATTPPVQSAGTIPRLGFTWPFVHCKTTATASR